MSDGGLTVVDGSRLRDVDPRLPNTEGAITGAQLLEIAESEVSSSIFGLSLPKTLKCNALKRINIDADSFNSAQLDIEEASSKLREFVIAIADELEDDPLIVSVLDGNPLRLFLEDEDDFAMLAENLFTDLDTEDKGKIQRNEIKNALVHMGVEMGVPPILEFSLLNDILKKHGAEGDEELGQAQFAQLLQPVLQDLADALAAQRHVVIMQKVKIINGSKLRKLLADEEDLKNVIEQIFQDVVAGKNETGCSEGIRGFLEKNGAILSLPLPSEANEAVELLYDEVFADVGNKKIDGELGRDEFGVLMKDILKKLAEQLKANPILHDIDN